MLKKSIIITLLFIVSACTREVYLQPVPCVEGSCQECPCKDGALECCAELKKQTEIQHYQIYDIPSQPTVYTEEKTTCRKVCRKVKVTPTTQKEKEILPQTESPINETSTDDLTAEIMND